MTLDAQDPRRARGHVLFVDPARRRRPCCDRMLPGESLGATVATTLRVARGLARRGWQVTLAQQGRQDAVLGSDGVCYAPFDRGAGLPGLSAVDAVVLMHQPKLLGALRRRYPSARLMLWLHDFPGRRRGALGALALETRATVVAVSECHRRAVLERIAHRDPLAARRLAITTVYGPLDEALSPDPWGAFDPDRLVFLSSPRKGLAHVVEAFAAVRRCFPTMRLCLIGPGQQRAPAALAGVDGLEALGNLSYDEAMAHVRGALCLFHPQASFAEAFGLALAEANALGTPVLTHPLGAAQEVVRGSPSQLVDASDHGAIVARIASWREGGRPHVVADPRFRLDAVLDRWEALLGRSARRRSGAAVPQPAGASPGALG